MHPDPARAADLEAALGPREPARLTEAYRIDRAGDATTAIVVTFVVLGAPIARATFVFDAPSGRRHTEADLRLAEEIARRAAQIVENARLHAELAQALAYRERVMGILGHDLRNPVAAVIALAARCASARTSPSAPGRAWTTSTAPRRG